MRTQDENFGPPPEVAEILDKLSALEAQLKEGADELNDLIGDASTEASSEIIVTVTLKGHGFSFNVRGGEWDEVIARIRACG